MKVKRAMHKLKEMRDAFRRRFDCLVRRIFINHYRADCRRCRAPLHKPGGCAFYPLGAGFCYVCADKLLKKLNDA